MNYCLNLGCFFPRCPYEATQAAHLRRHMEIHNVIKKYACQHCSYTANTLSSLKVHHTRSHKGLPYKTIDVPVVEETGLGTAGASQVSLRLKVCLYAEQTQKCREWFDDYFRYIHVPYM